MEDEVYGIDKDRAHSRAQKLVPEDFFWDNADELAPFGSDEGDSALAEYRDWRRDNPTRPVMECVGWTVESVGDMSFDNYNDSLLSDELVAWQLTDEDFDDRQFVYTLDVSIIVTVFGQLVDEGKIDADIKSVASVALSRQILWSRSRSDWRHADEYISNLRILKRVLEDA